jgi:hypothetical protein
VLARVRYLHPILYQHGPTKISNNVKVKFVQGVTFKYEERAGFGTGVLLALKPTRSRGRGTRETLQKIWRCKKPSRSKGLLMCRERNGGLSSWGPGLHVHPLQGRRCKGRMRV